MKTENKQLFISGKILEIGAQESGDTWQKQEFTVVTIDKYPNEVRFSVWNKNLIWLERVKVGDIVNVYFNMLSQKHNEKWYTVLTAWRIEVNIWAMQEELKQVSTNDNQQ
jgi:hypothetical protein